MKWYRSYLKDMETTLACADQTGRAFVYDPGHCEPYWAEGSYGYWGLFEKVSENFCLMEWDIALSFEDRKLFEQYCLSQPDIVHVAPFRHYGYRKEYSEFGYMHRTSKKFFVREGDPYCFYFGFGLIYIPLEMVRGYMRDCYVGKEVVTEGDVPLTLYPGKMMSHHTFDCLFSYWHAATTNMRPVPIHWDVRPIHLHYDVIPHFDRARAQLEERKAQTENDDPELAS